LIFIPNFSEGKGKDFSTNQEQKECFFIKNAELSHVIDIQEAIGDKPLPANEKMDVHRDKLTFILLVVGKIPPL